MVRAIVISLMLSLLIALSAWSQTEEDSTGNILNVLVGEWEGTGTLYYPRDTTGREPRIENVTASCRKILKDSYVQCSSSWVRTTDGRVRDLEIFWNYDDENHNFQILFLYDNWPGKVNYPLSYDPEARRMTGSDSFTAPNGTPAKERVEWIFSEDGSEIRSREYNHYETDPEDYWPLNFEFVWQRRK